MQEKTVFVTFMNVKKFFGEDYTQLQSFSEEGYLVVSFSSFQSEQNMTTSSMVPELGRNSVYSCISPSHGQMFGLSTFPPNQLSILLLRRSSTKQMLLCPLTQKPFLSSFSWLGSSFPLLSSQDAFFEEFRLLHSLCLMLRVLPTDPTLFFF